MNPFKGDKSKISAYMKKVEDMTEKAMKYTGLRNKGYIGAAAIIGTAAIADLWMDVRENNHARHTELEQERSIKKQRKKDIEDRWVGLEDPMQYNGAVQQMFNSRIGHSNSWGGRRY